MRPRKGTMKSIYCLCQQCTAKWFCGRLPQGCPRCRSHDFLTTLARRPWTRAPDASENATRAFQNSTEPQVAQNTSPSLPIEGASLASA